MFGFRSDVKDNVLFAEDGSIIYPSGHNVVLYSPDTRQQRLIPGTLESEGITAMCVSSNKRLLAVAERSEKAMITVYDLQTLKRRKVLVATDAGSKVSTVINSNMSSRVCMLRACTLLGARPRPHEFGGRSPRMCGTLGQAGRCLRRCRPKSPRSPAQ